MESAIENHVEKADEQQKSPLKRKQKSKDKDDKDEDTPVVEPKKKRKTTVVNQMRTAKPLAPATSLVNPVSFFFKSFRLT